MASDAPNILVITTDQQRFDTVLPWRPSWLRTPHLDNLQCEGVNFTRAAEAADKQAELRAELIRRHADRGLGYVADGELVVTPHQGDKERERRNQAHPGYMTEHNPNDVKH